MFFFPFLLPPPSFFPPPTFFLAGGHPGGERQGLDMHPYHTPWGASLLSIFSFPRHFFFVSFSRVILEVTLGTLTFPTDPPADAQQPTPDRPTSRPSRKRTIIFLTQYLFSQVILEVNGERWFVPVTDNSAQSPDVRY